MNVIYVEPRINVDSQKSKLNVLVEWIKVSGSLGDFIGDLIDADYVYLLDPDTKTVRNIGDYAPTLIVSEGAELLTIYEGNDACSYFEYTFNDPHLTRYFGTMSLKICSNSFVKRKVKNIKEEINILSKKTGVSKETIMKYM